MKENFYILVHNPHNNPTSLITKLLKPKKNIHLVLSQNLPDSIKFLFKIRFNLIIIMMDDINDIKIMGYLKENSHIQNIPFIVVCQRTSKKDMYYVYENNSLDYLSYDDLSDYKGLRLLTVIDLLVDNYTNDYLVKKDKEKLLNSAKHSTKDKLSNKLFNGFDEYINLISTIITSMQYKFKTKSFDQAYFHEKVEQINQYNLEITRDINYLKSINHNTKIKSDIIITNIMDSTLNFFKKEIKQLNVDVITHYNIKSGIIHNRSDISHIFIYILYKILKTIKYREIEKPFIHIDIFDQNSSQVIIIEDNAKGFEQDALKNFRNTSLQEINQQNGLGLITCNEILKSNNNSSLDIKNINDGALFKIIINH